MLWDIMINISNSYPSKAFIPYSKQHCM